MIIAAALKHMLAAGMDHDAIVAAVADMEANAPKDAQAERKRAADRDRLREKRLRAMSRDTGDKGDMVSPKKETSPTPPKEKTTPSQSEPNGSSKTPRQALECVLDQQRAGDVIEMRQRIRKPLTARAAELLAAQLAKWHDPNEAADAMVLHSWQGFKPEYLQSKQARGSPQRPPANGTHHFTTLAEETIDEPERAFGSDQSDRHDARGFPVVTIADYRRHG